ncbi:MAG: hypothetical protein M1401_13190 [Chloroflexi bacterium]|nr:hypothetical protein [Chloroflexota bacterium]
MGRRRHTLLVVVVTVLTITAIIGVGGVGSFQPFAPASPSATGILLRQTPSPVQKPTSIFEAWDALAAYAASWRGDALMVEMRSLDDGADPANAGMDGHRLAWGALFVSERTPRLQLSVRYVNGSVVEAIQQGYGGEPLAVLLRPRMDSTDAIRLVLAKVPGFAPAGEMSKGRGLHFVAGSQSGASPAGLVITGQEGGVPLSVEVDTTTGQIVGQKEYAAAKLGGLMYSSDGGRTWRASNLTGVYVAQVAADPTRADSAYALVPDRQFVPLYRTGDAGVTWHTVGSLPADAGNWAFDLLVLGDEGAVPSLLVGTRTGLWVSFDDCRRWQQVAQFPQAPTQWLAVARSGGVNHVFATVSAGAQAGTYSSADLKAWAKTDGVVRRLSSSVGGTAVLALEDTGAGPTPGIGTQAAQVLGPDAQPRPLAVPIGALRAAGTVDGSGTILAETPAGVLRSADGGRSWETTLSAGLASLAVAPGFAQNGLALAGGFRAGIYRSEDGGRTWTEVLSRPVDVVPGNGTVPGVLFLSDSHAVAISEGKIEWQSR